MIQDLGLLTLEQHIAVWQETDKQKQIVSITINGEDISVVLLKGYHVFHSMMPSVVKDSVNFSTTDQAIQDLVKKYFPLGGTHRDKYEKLYHCIAKNHMDVFQLRFFPSLAAIEDEIQQAEKTDKDYKDPKPMCVLV